MCLQETHGYSEEILAEIAILLPLWLCFHSPVLLPDGIVAPGAGGVLILVCPELVLRTDLVHKILIPGRCQMLRLVEKQDPQTASGDGLSWNCDRAKAVTLLNVHNFGLTRNDIMVIGNCVELCSVRDAASPQTSITFLVGDFNLRSVEDPPFRLGESNSVTEHASMGSSRTLAQTPTAEGRGALPAASGNDRSTGPISCRKPSFWPRAATKFGCRSGPWAPDDGDQT